MIMTLKAYVQKALDTVRDPQMGARWVMSSSMARSQRWETLILILVVSIILVEITFFLSGSLADAFLGGAALLNPLVSFVIQLLFLVITVYCVYFIGKWAGGTGSFSNSILLVAWLEFVLTCLQVIQLIAFVVFPLIAALISLVNIVLFFWLLTNFVTELHGFKSKGRVFGAIFAVIVGSAFCFVFVVLSFSDFNIAG